MIEQYLRELARLLPGTRRERFLREAEDHLRDRASALVAAGVPTVEAERRAVEAFGPVEEVARGLAGVAAVHATRRAAVLALGALALLVVPLYAIPENTFGPAQWEAKPVSVTATQLVAVGVWLAALGLGAAAVAAAFLDRSRAAGVLLATAVTLAFATGVAVLTACAVWLEHAPWTPLWSALGLVVPATIVLVCIAAGALAWAWARRPLLDPTAR